MAENPPKNPRRAEVLTRGKSFSSEGARYEMDPNFKPFHTPRVQNQMLDKFLAFMLGPNNPNISKGEISFLPSGPGSMILGGMSRGAGTEEAITKEMVEKFAANRAAQVEADLAKRYARKVERPLDFPIGEVKQVGPHLTEVGPPPGVEKTMGLPLEELFKRLVWGK